MRTQSHVGATPLQRASIYKSTITNTGTSITAPSSVPLGVKRWWSFCVPYIVHSDVHGANQRPNHKFPWLPPYFNITDCLSLICKSLYLV